MRTTLPCEDFPHHTPDVDSNDQKPVLQQDGPKPSSVPVVAQNETAVKDPGLGARRFHLARNHMPVSPLSPRTSGQRHGRNREHVLAVFVEQTAKVTKAKPHRRDKHRHNNRITQQDNGAGRIDAEPTPARKRPNASAAEREWRATNWAKPSDSNGNTDSLLKTPLAADGHSLELAQELQGIALQEVNPQNDSISEIKPRPLRTQPKPPKPRQSTIQQDTDDTATSNMSADELGSDDEDYVIDTYVRTDAQTMHGFSSAKAFEDPIGGLDDRNVGIIVIDDGEEEELWEAFGDPDSDVDWNSEEEDENGSSIPL